MTAGQLRIYAVSIASALGGTFLGFALGLNNAVESAARAETVCLLDLEFQRQQGECKRMMAEQQQVWNEWFDQFRKPTDEEVAQHVDN